jgi:tRNA U38,U39,U40 pseudouridine synthase TruA
LRPVLHGLCRYESLKDGSLDLADVALMNDALDVKFDNEQRWYEYYQQKG